jgi:hypothetical protein
MMFDALQKAQAIAEKSYKNKTKQWKNYIIYAHGLGG